MIGVLIKLLERCDHDRVCEEGLDGVCSWLDCKDCPFFSHENKNKLIKELEMK